jgi:DNA processing protein
LNNKVLYLIALKSIPHIGDVLAHRIIETIGDAATIFSMSDVEIAGIAGLTSKAARMIIENRSVALRTAEAEIEFIEKHKIQFISSFDDEYPSRLKHCLDAPLFLFYKGTAPVESAFMTAVVGTRKSTVYGRKMTEQLVAGLNLKGMTIVSGLAYGIDTTAHQAAVDNGIPTIGVMGHGFKHLYPEENRKLATQMLKNGGLLTEFLSTELPEKQNFPIRNRIIAGMSDAVVVAEAQSKGGALITAEIANSYSRDVFTFPGRVDDQKSRGCNWLIRTQRATLIESAEHLKYFMNWTQAEKHEIRQVRMEVLLDPDAQKVYDFLLEKGEQSIDSICNDLGISINSAAMVLLELEFQGVVAALPGKRYRLKYA